MALAHVTLVFKQVIDATSTGLFEKAVHQLTYQEFLLKSQAYNRAGKFKTFDDIRLNDGRANSLHYKLSFPVLPLIESLNKVVPGWYDKLNNNLFFEEAKFELLTSDITDQSKHRVAIYYTTPILTLYQVIGKYLLLSKEDSKLNESVDYCETFMVNLVPGDVYKLDKVIIVSGYKGVIIICINRQLKVKG
jgi:type VI protein secretion system component Hcp